PVPLFLCVRILLPGVDIRLRVSDADAGTKESTTGTDAGGAFSSAASRRDAAVATRVLRRGFASLLGSGADAAIACPGQVASSRRNGQEITSFVQVRHRA
ncbi:MAG TPA: hypothetical protein VEQ60_11145, partial [Longimicrobium sp.]|nr:hypothetical protein [Longimicrobium sp.]